MTEEEQKKLEEEEAKKKAEEEQKNKETEEAKKMLEMSNELKNLKKENEDLKEAKRNYYDKILQVEPEQDNKEKEEENNFDLKKFSEDFFKTIDTNKNLDIAKNLLKINAERKRKGLPSGFLPVSSEEAPTYREEQLYDYGGIMEQVLEKSIEEAKDDPEAFNVSLTRYVKGFKAQQTI